MACSWIMSGFDVLSALASFGRQNCNVGSQTIRYYRLNETVPIRATQSPKFQ